MTVNSEILAKISNGVYRDPVPSEPNKGYHRIPEGWQFVESSYRTDNKEGYFGAAFKKGNTIIIAHRGTNQIKDWDDDYAYHLAKKLPDQFRDAMRFTEQIIRKVGKDIEIIHTGHSHGGGISELMGIKTGARAVSFDAPGVRDIAINEFKITSFDSHKITSYASAPNAINTVGRHIVTPIQLKVDTPVESLGRIDYLQYTSHQHKIEKIVEAFDPVTGNPKGTVATGEWPSGFQAGYDHFVKAILQTADKPYILAGLNAEAISKKYNIPLERIQESKVPISPLMEDGQLARAFAVLPETNKGAQFGKSDAGESTYGPPPPPKPEADSSFFSGWSFESILKGAKSYWYSPKEYVVKEGDTLWKIAKDYGMSDDELLNTGGNEYLRQHRFKDDFGRDNVRIKPGDKINIPGYQEYKPYFWNAHSNYGSTINGKYDFMNWYNFGNHNSPFGFGKTVYGQFYQWDSNLHFYDRSYDDIIKFIRNAKVESWEQQSYNRDYPKPGKQYSSQENDGGKQEEASSRERPWYKSDYEKVSKEEFESYNTKPWDGPSVRIFNPGRVYAHVPINDNTAFTGNIGRGGYGFGFSFKIPLVIDLKSDGIKLIPLEESIAFYDVEDKGYLKNLGWPDKEDALLAIDIDIDGDGIIS